MRNVAHPLTDEHGKRIGELAGKSIDELRTLPVQIAQAHTLEPQVRAIVDRVGLSSREWQTNERLINPPGDTPATFVLLAELHGRIGHVPALIRLRPRQGPITTDEIAELRNLQAIREEARNHRS